MTKKMKNIISALNSIFKENPGKLYTITTENDIISYHNHDHHFEFFEGAVFLCDRIGYPIAVIAMLGEEKNVLLKININDTMYYITITDTPNESVLITL